MAWEVGEATGDVSVPGDRALFQSAAGQQRQSVLGWAVSHVEVSPQYPSRAFGSLAAAQEWVQRFVR